MRLNYVTKIEANLKNYKRIYTKRVTSRIMDGSYKSVYKGRSMNFDEIRDYVVGDDIKDVDWKASARSRKLVVRQYIAEKKHNIMLIMDTNKRMLADTDCGQQKSELAILSAGTLAYLVNLNGDYISSTYAVESINENGQTTSINHTPFRTGLPNLEGILQGYNKSVQKKNNSNLDTVISYVARNFNRKMIAVIVTDLEGLNEISDASIKQLMIRSDVLVIRIDSARLDGKSVYDIAEDKYLPDFFARDKKLIKRQKERVLQMEQSCDEKIKRLGIKVTDIRDTGDLDDAILKLLHR